MAARLAAALIVSLWVVVVLGSILAWQQWTLVTQRRLQADLPRQADVAWAAAVAVDGHSDTRLAYIEQLMSSAEKDARLSRGVFGQPAYRPTDPMEAHVQDLMTAFTGLPPNLPVPRPFLDAVRRAIPGYLRDRRGYCRWRALQPVLTAMLREEIGTRGPGAGSWDQLAYLAWVESRLSPRVCSAKGARGMWQFMPATARQYALRVERGHDERCDWRKSTGAAARFLGDLFADFEGGYPFLAIASYNSGEVRTRRVRDSLRIPKESRNFLAFYQQGLLPRETQEYVPRFIAAAYVGGHHAEAAAWLARSGGGSAPAAEPTCPASDLALPPSQACTDTCEEVIARPASAMAGAAASEDVLPEGAPDLIPIVWGE